MYLHDAFRLTLHEYKETGARGEPPKGGLALRDLLHSLPRVL